MRRLTDSNRLSIVLPSSIKEWDYDRNVDLTPNDVSFSSNKKVWWMCENGHSYNMAIQKKSSGSSCPYCNHQRVCNDNSLGYCNPELSKEWHPIRNKSLKPQHVSSGSNMKVWWLGKCGHEWMAIIANRNKGVGCPKCYKEFKRRNMR